MRETFEPLTLGESQMAILAADGMPNRQMAARLERSPAG